MVRLVITLCLGVLIHAFSDLLAHNFHLVRFSDKCANDASHESRDDPSQSVCSERHFSNKIRKLFIF